METLVKLKVELTGNKSYYLYNGTEQYYRKMRTACKDIQAGNTAAYLHFGFFTLCAATLEYSLNFILADSCVDKFGIERYRTYLEEYISLKFKNKLLMLPHIISDGRFVMNEDTAAFKRLSELINLRNRLLHNKEFLTEFELPLNLKVEDGGVVVPTGQKIIDFSFEVKDNPIDLLTRENCLYYGQAMGEFKKHVMRPALSDGLEVNPMIKPT